MNFWIFVVLGFIKSEAGIISSETNKDVGIISGKTKFNEKIQARFYETNDVVFTSQGISIKKPKPPGHGRILSAPILKEFKLRSEGDFKWNSSKVHVGKIDPPSHLLKQRFRDPIEVKPSLIERELPFDFSDDTGPIDEENSVEPKKFSDEIVRFSFPSSSEIFKGFQYPPELQEKPAFCRRCFRFWRSVARTIPNATLLEYCCTTGQQKGRIRKTFIPI